MRYNLDIAVELKMGKYPVRIIRCGTTYIYTVFVLGCEVLVVGLEYISIFNHLVVFVDFQNATVFLLVMR